MSERPIIALLYDFDKTLCTTDMEDYTFIPSLGYTPAEFWQKANNFGWENQMDGLLAYMYTMIEECRAQGMTLNRDYLVQCGKGIQLFPGVREWFDRIDAFGDSLGVTVEHYVLSSGLKEIIEGTEIAHEFRRIYACSFLYDIDGVAYWPAVAVNYTNKTQFIFKINKGVESVFDSKLVNQYIEEDKRPVPFRRMIYVGDGTTDIPCMRLVKNSGGHSIAVYNPEIRNARRELNGLIRDNRVSHVCPADYSEGSEMDTLVKTIIDKIEADHRLELLETPRT